MLIEGKGKVAPKPVAVFVPLACRKVCQAESERRTQARGYGRRPDRWGQGLIQNPIYIGCLGELAWTTHINARLGLKLPLLDNSDRPRGDGGVDLSLFGFALQFKTRGKSTEALIKRQEESGRIVRWPWGVCCFATAAPEPCHPWESLRVTLDGFLWKRDVVRLAKMQPSRVAGHVNAFAHAHDFRPVSELISLLQAKKILAEVG